MNAQNDPGHGHSPAAWTAVTSYGQPGSYYRPSRRAYSPDPSCGDPAFQSAYLNSATDSFCRLDYSDFFDLAPEETRTQVFADYRRPVGDMRLSLQAAGSATSTTARRMMRNWLSPVFAWRPSCR